MKYFLLQMSALGNIRKQYTRNMDIPRPPVFVSYASQNRDLADSVCKYLEDQGIMVWMAPRDILPGEVWEVALVKAISECKALVLIFSAPANESQQVNREVAQAASNGKIIVPMRIEDVTPSGAMAYYIGNRQWLDALVAPIEPHLDYLAGSLKTLLSALGSMAARLAKPDGARAPFTQEAERKPPPATASPPGTHDAGAPHHPPETTKTRTPAKDLGPLPRPPSFDEKEPVEKSDHFATDAALTDFGSDARRVIGTAQSLAKHCGSPEITHRLLVAAFVSAPDLFASRVCRTAGVDPILLSALLAALSFHAANEDESRPDVKLTIATCGRIMFPAMERARSIAANPHAISERELFRAFCEVADPGFVEFLKSVSQDEDLEPIELDLAELREIDPDNPGRLEGLTLRARTVVRQAHQLAQQRRVLPIPNRLMLAAFLANPQGLATGIFQGGSVSPDRLCELLVNSANGSQSAAFPLNDEACSRIITPMLIRARALAGPGGFITERLLFRGFCEAAEPRMKIELKSFGVDLDALGAAEPEPPPAPSPVQPPAKNPPSKNPPGRGSTWGLN